MVQKKVQMKVALITGGLGFIGTNLAVQLLKTKKINKCILLDNFSSYIDPSLTDYKDYRKNRLNMISSKVVERCDTKNFSALLNLIEKYKPEYIFHTAALPLAKINNLTLDEAKEGSIDSTMNILDAIHKSENNFKKYRCKRFVYFSSSMVYGDFKKSIVNEEDETNPKDAYGVMKLAGELITKGISKLYNIPYTIIRPSAVYGPMDMNKRVSQIFIEKALNGELIKIAGKNEKLDFTYIDDLSNGCVKAAFSKKGIGETFNITCGSGRKIIDFVKILEKMLPNVNYKIIPRDKTKPSRGTLSIKKAEKLIKYKPKFSLEKGIQSYLNFLSDN